jgi:hypothetical protein
MCLPVGKGIFRLWRKIPARASPSPYTGIFCVGKESAQTGKTLKRLKNSLNLTVLYRRFSMIARKETENSQTLHTGFSGLWYTGSADCRKEEIT